VGHIAQVSSLRSVFGAQSANVVGSLQEPVKTVPMVKTVPNAFLTLYPPSTLISGPLNAARHTLMRMPMRNRMQHGCHRLPSTAEGI